MSAVTKSGHDAKRVGNMVNRVRPEIYREFSRRFLQRCRDLQDKVWRSRCRPPLYTCRQNLLFIRPLNFTSGHEWKDIAKRRAFYYSRGLIERPFKFRLIM